MVKNHLKRICAPSSWDIARKKTTFIAKPNPCGHAMSFCMPLSVLLVENLSLFNTRRELKHALNNKEVKVNQKVVCDTNAAIGLLDTISVSKLGLHWRLVLDVSRKLRPVAIDAKESNLRISRIIGKKHIRKGALQLSTNDGRTILVDLSKKTEIEQYKTGNSLVLELPSQKILSVLAFKPGCMVYLFKGRQAGKIGTLENINDGEIIISIDKEKFQTKRAYALAVGTDKLSITIVK